MVTDLTPRATSCPAVRAATHEHTWFDRVLCGVCDGMHTYCTDCGARLDNCETITTEEVDHG